MKISLFASAIKPFCWEPLLNSLKSNKVEYEVVFAGPLDRSVFSMICDVDLSKMQYIQTKYVKPAQCYEIARRACTGELVMWFSDDCVFPEGALDKICDKWLYGSSQYVLAIANNDSACPNNNLNEQRFFSRNLNTPQMAQFGVMSRKYLEDLGGLDRRYVFGKWESDICMRVLADGGKIIKYEDVVLTVDHTYKNGEYTNDWSGVNEDSETLEKSWVVGGYKDFEKAMYCYDPTDNTMKMYFPISNREVTLNRSDKFEPFEDKDILEMSQSIRGRW